MWAAKKWRRLYNTSPRGAEESFLNDIIIVLVLLGNKRHLLAALKLQMVESRTQWKIYYSRNYSHKISVNVLLSFSLLYDIARRRVRRYHLLWLENFRRETFTSWKIYEKSFRNWSIKAFSQGRNILEFWRINFFYFMTFH